MSDVCVVLARTHVSHPSVPYPCLVEASTTTTNASHEPCIYVQDTSPIQRLGVWVGVGGDPLVQHPIVHTMMQKYGNTYPHTTFSVRAHS